MRFSAGSSQFATPEVDGCCKLQFSVSSGSPADFIPLSAPNFKQDIQAETSKYSLLQTHSLDYFYGGHSFLDFEEYSILPVLSTRPCIKIKGLNCIAAIKSF
jgi:hypothetical protein